MKNLLKGQIPKEYRLDYGKTFSEQTDTVFEKEIDCEKENQAPWIRTTEGYTLTREDADIIEFDKTELLSILQDNGCHSVEQSDTEDKNRERLLDNKRFLYVYDHPWFKKAATIVYFTSSQPPENAPEWAYEIKYIYETDEIEYKDDDDYEIDDHCNCMNISGQNYDVIFK
ncbi:hypothetical protein C1646_768678 [Rhizophagus diaphanus]|nr:hypothetical protein C1646_768678 [Rhizophagus diaphanus] [Rhizophagus sp. MUCL 43196]